jgi:hypothetical protein
MRMILAEQNIIVSELQLPKRELEALEALKAAVEGKDQQLSQFMYANDRSDMLEQALAILQPNLVQSDARQVEDMRSSFEDVLHRVGELRTQLGSLTDAQDELEGGRKRDHAKAEGDSDDKPEPPTDDDASLTGPERRLAKPPSALYGPDVKEAPKPASTLAGPERKNEAKPSTLTGPELDDAPKPASTLGGPGPDADDPKPPSSLGDPADVAQAEEAAAAKKPWWRRPFG